jgi:cytoskeletal protein CcmA (bactofilin family)
MEDKTTAPSDDSLESLDTPATVVEPSGPTLTSDGPVHAAPGTESPKPPRRGLGDRFKSLNIYLLFFILIIIVAAAVGIAAYVASQRSSGTGKISSQTLDQKALEQLAATDATVGSSAQILNVQSNAIFAGKVLVRDTLEVAGQLQVGGSLSLSGVTVSGSSSFDQVQVNKNLGVAGDTGLQGSLTVQKSLNVSGNGSFGGTLSAGQFTATSFQLNGDLNLTHHITAGGPTPSRSNGSALGGGGTVSVSGSDTSGSVSINTGGGPSAGCFVTLTFTSKFNSTPHVLLTPVGSSAAGISYYVNRSTTNFSICTTSNPPANANFGFDYFILD